MTKTPGSHTAFLSGFKKYLSPLRVQNHNRPGLSNQLKGKLLHEELIPFQTSHVDSYLICIKSVFNFNPNLHIILVN